MANYLDCYLTVKRWMNNQRQGKNLGDYFSQYPYEKVAIYGAGDIGKLLYEEMRDSGCRVAYFIDKCAEGQAQEQGIKVILPDEIRQSESVDAIIISSLADYEEIARDISERGILLPLVFLRDAIYEV